MAASGILVLVLTLLSDQLIALPQINTVSTTVKPSQQNETTTISPGCVSSRGLAGSCVERLYCEYGTNAIDLTLYMPHGYTQICTNGTVCCPTSFQLPQEATQKPDDDDFQFDSGDDY